MRLDRITLALCCVCAAHVVQAQSQPQLSPATRDTLTRLVDSARVAGLPTEPLVSRAAEGVLKRVTEDRIIAAVRNLVRRQHEAREALPSNVGDATLAAGVSALQAGVSSQTLRRLSSVPRVSESDLAVSLVTVADLVASRVQAEAAANAVEQLLRRGASEQTMTSLRLAVQQDIQTGTAPDAALSFHTYSNARRLDRDGGDRTRAPVARPPLRQE